VSAPEFGQVDAFLRLLFDDVDGLIEIRPIEDKRGGKVVHDERCWLSVDELIERRASMRDRFRERGWACFYGVLPRTETGGGKAEHAAPGRVVWVDVDFHDFESEIQARAAVQDLPMRPTVIVCSGHGLHLYWLLSEEQRPGNLSLLSDALQLRVGGDACFDAARILRLPGSWNVKDRKNPRLVTIEEMDPRRIYHYEDLAEMHADDLTHAAQRAKARAGGAIDGKPLDFGQVGEGLPEVVEAVHLRWPHVADLFAGRGKSSGDISGSGYDFSYTLALLDKGIREPGILLTALVARQRAVGRSPRARDLTRCVERAVALAASRGQAPPSPADDDPCAPWRNMPVDDVDSAPPRPDGFQVLAGIVEAIEATERKPARTLLLAGLYSDSTALAQVVAAWVDRPAALEGLLLRLAVALSQTAATGLRKRLEADAKATERPRPAATSAARDDDTSVLEWGDEPELADRLIADLGGQDHLATEADRLYRYDDGVGTWDEVNPSWLRGLLFDRYERAWIRQEQPDKTGEMVESWKPVKLSARTAAGVVSIVVDKVDRRNFLRLDQPLGVPFANGLVDAAGVLRPFERDDWIREGQRLEIAYDRRAVCPEWMAMLRRIWPMELTEFEVRVQLLQEFFASAMFGLATRYQKVLVLVGEGQNGKSIVSKVLRSLFPASVCTAVPIQRMGDPYYTEMLLNSRVNVVGELPAADVYEASGFKDIVDGGVITARRIREAPITFAAKAAHLFAANTLPPVSDHSTGFWRRWMALDFPRRFRETDDDYDPDILDKVTVELPGIARWVVAGAAPLIARKHYESIGVSEEIIDAWRCDSNSVAMFAIERMERDVDGRVPAGEVYRAYVTWCQDNGFKPVNVTNFGRRMVSLDYGKARAGTGMIYQVHWQLHVVEEHEQRNRQQEWRRW